MSKMGPYDYMQMLKNRVEVHVPEHEFFLWVDDHTGGMASKNIESLMDTCRVLEKEKTLSAYVACRDTAKDYFDFMISFLPKMLLEKNKKRLERNV